MQYSLKKEEFNFNKNSWSLNYEYFKIEITIKRTDSYSYTFEYARSNMLIKRFDSIITEALD